MLCDVNKISRIPTMHQYVLASFYPPHSSSSSAQSPTVDQSAARHAQVSLWHITAGFMISQFSHAAATGKTVCVPACSRTRAW